MKKIRNFLILIIFLGTALYYFGSLAWKQFYRIPRERNEAALEKVRGELATYTSSLEKIRRENRENTVLLARSFPLDRASGQTRYQVWLTEMAEFCGMKEPAVTVGEYKKSSAMAVLTFQLKGSTSMVSLYRFLYEFSWAAPLHRIASLDLVPQEDSDLLRATVVIEGLSLAKLSPRSPYPAMTEFPSTGNWLRRLTSGPFAAYEPIASEPLFSYVAPGLDPASYTLLTGTPEISDTTTGQTVVVTRWKIETEDRSLTLKRGERLTIGSFDATIEDIQGDMVILSQTDGRRWLLMLGDRLPDAVALAPGF
ncbi:MAG: hypothetical protein Q4G68_01450 [Planctomycetia bacterium]|nr:hypothetical protein [Planctomycetia bacterium]